MNSFNFGRKVEICGEIYYLDSDMEKVAKTMKECSEQMIVLSQEKSLTEEQMMEKVHVQSRETIDTVLGNGAYDRIFEKVKPNLLNLISLVDFITAEIKEWRIELAAKKAAGETLVQKMSRK